jgi:broad specificity phosphatase PhoE
MIAATSLFLLRHAEVEPKYQRIFGGKIDMNLSPRGHEQAAKLAGYLTQKKFDAVYSSPMKRVQQTMVPFMTGPHPKPVIMPGLREVDFGDWTGLGWEQVREKYNISAFDWVNQIDQGLMPNAETGETFRARVAPCVQQILQDHPGQNVAVFCHGGVIRMILSILMNLPFQRMNLFEIEYASLTEVHCSPQRTEVQILNFTPWRDLV